MCLDSTGGLANIQFETKTTNVIFSCFFVFLDFVPIGSDFLPLSLVWISTPPLFTANLVIAATRDSVASLSPEVGCRDAYATA